MEKSAISEMLGNAGEWLSANPRARNAMIGGLAAAAAGGGLTAASKEREGESRGQRRLRILRNALVTGSMGAAIPGLLDYASGQFRTADTKQSDPFFSTIGNWTAGGLAAAGAGKAYATSRFTEGGKAQGVLDTLRRQLDEVDEAGKLVRKGGDWDKWRTTLRGTPWGEAGAKPSIIGAFKGHTAKDTLARLMEQDFLKNTLAKGKPFDGAAYGLSSLDDVGMIDDSLKFGDKLKAHGRRALNRASNYSRVGGSRGKAIAARGGKLAILPLLALALGHKRWFSKKYPMAQNTPGGLVTQ